jgi:uncharacterized protein (DUF1778 family)
MNPSAIRIRAAAEQRDLIDQAADHLGRSRSDFILEAACRRAEDMLLDQTYFVAPCNQGPCSTSHQRPLTACAVS